ncbi:MAG: hypothetical protein KUG75_11305 [Pseudomonadales bacterium]|nr:hypothetical protein [Pseudomonadales bacterium]
MPGMIPTKSFKMTLSILGVMSATLLSVSILASDFDAVSVKLKSAMASDIRSAAEVARDKNRKPIETLAFFGLRDNMKVIELMPGGGWYTKLLAPVLAENGELYIAFGASRVFNALKDKPGFENLKLTAINSAFERPEGQPFYNMTHIKLGVKKADMVFTFRNYHNFGTTTRADLNAAAFKALKKGGIYALVDHTRRHMQKLNDENRRRFDPVLAIKEIEAAGFEFVDFSNIHYRADDELKFEVGRKTVTGNTDRWTLKFRKP